MDLCTRMYRVRKTALEMLQDRGYVITSVRLEMKKYLNIRPIPSLDRVIPVEKMYIFCHALQRVYTCFFSAPCFNITAYGIG